MAHVTLVGRSLAQPGTEFVTGEETPGCKGCKYVSFCFNIPRGTRLRVTGARGVEHPCLIHEDLKVAVVEVERSTFDAGVVAGFAKDGLTISHHPWQCPVLECVNQPLCSQPLIATGTRLRVKGVGRELDCPLGQKRRQVVLEQVP
jgi:hypothetical protein